MINSFMQTALDKAKHSQGDIPVGAVIVKNGCIISQACNTREKDNDITSHAEILAIKQASQTLNNWRLDDCDMYVTLEPCPMCGWAILQSRIKNLYFGSFDTKYGAFSAANLDKISQSKTKIYSGIMEQDCNELIENFFSEIRKK